MVAYQIGIFLIIILSSIFGWKALGITVMGCIAFTLAKVFTLKLMIIQMITIILATIIAVLTKSIYKIIAAWMAQKPLAVIFVGVIFYIITAECIPIGVLELTIPIIFGAIFGPVQGLLVGVTGGIVVKMFFYIFVKWHWVVISSILGLCAGLATQPKVSGTTQFRYNSLDRHR